MNNIVLYSLRATLMATPEAALPTEIACQTIGLGSRRIPPNARRMNSLRQTLAVDPLCVPAYVSRLAEGRVG